MISTISRMFATIHDSNRALRLSPLLVLTAGLIALAVFFVHHSRPAAADHRTTNVWSATLTVKDLGGARMGCDNSKSGYECSSALTDSDFTYDGVDYEVISANLRRGTLIIALDMDIPAEMNVLTLRAGGVGLALADHTSATNDSATWNRTGLSWSEGDMVELSLLELPVDVADWAPILTPQKLGGGDLGCKNGVSGAECSSESVLTEDHFTYTRMIYGQPYDFVYTVRELYLTPEGDLVLTMSSSIPTGIPRGFTMSVVRLRSFERGTSGDLDGAEVPGTSADFSTDRAGQNEHRTQARWTDTGLEWYAGWDVRLGMKRPYAILDTLYVHWDDDEQGDFAEYGVATLASYGLRALVNGSATHVKLTPRVAHAGSTVRVGRVTYDSSGRGTARLRSVNNGEQSAAIELGNTNTIIEVEVTDSGVVNTYTLGISKAGGP